MQGEKRLKEGEGADGVEPQEVGEGFKNFSPTVMPAVVVRQRKPYRRKDGVTLYFEGTACSNLSTLKTRASCD